MTSARFVIDASAAIGWVMNEDGMGPQLEPLVASARLVVPALWLLEVANSFLAKERRRKMLPHDVSGVLAKLDALDTELVCDVATRSLVAIAAFARPHQLTTYDATYLELAARLALPLLTTDHNLQDAARRLGVPLLLDRHAPQS